MGIIHVPMVESDPFVAGNCTSMTLKRSEFTHDNNGVRQQVNDITAFVDASNVYGSDSARAMAHRTGEGGKLKTSENGLLPPKNTAGLANEPDTTDEFFLAGRWSHAKGKAWVGLLFVKLF